MDSLKVNFNHYEPYLSNRFFHSLPLVLITSLRAHGTQNKFTTSLDELTTPSCRRSSRNAPGPASQDSNRRYTFEHFGLYNDGPDPQGLNCGAETHQHCQQRKHSASSHSARDVAHPPCPRSRVLPPGARDTIAIG